MKIRTLLILTAILSSILGAVVVYLALSIPNDLRADAMLEEARTELAAGRRDKAREILARVIQQYPRTDAAAAATIALSTIGQNERNQMTRAIGLLRRQNEEQSRRITALESRLKATSDAQAKAAEDAKAQAAANTAAAKKTTPKKTTKRRR